MTHGSEMYEYNELLMALARRPCDDIVRVKAKVNVSIASVAIHRRTLPQGDEAQPDPKRRG